MKEKTKYTVDRSNWRCGGRYGDDSVSHGTGATQLLNEEGFMCCLGFVTRQLLPDVEILGVYQPRDIDVKYLLNKNTKLSQDAMCINDDSGMPYEERERRLTELFKRHGYELEFIGKY